MNNYVVYHLHSDMSNGVTNIDSVTKCTDYIQRAEELGMSAMAFSEHGSVFGWYEKKKEMEKCNIKYIHAEEFYVTEKLFEYPDESELAESLLGANEKEAQEILYNFLESGKKKIRDNYHCVLIAKNWDGVKEINKLCSKSFNRTDGHFYYVPRITFDELRGTSNNIIITTACLGGILSKGNYDIQNNFLSFLKQNKERCYLEIQHHNVLEQKEYNEKLYRISQEYQIPLIAGTDTHSLNKFHEEGRTILQKAKGVLFAEENNWDLKFKTYDELCDAYKIQNTLPKNVYLEAIENTNVMASKVEFFNMDKSTKYPHIYNNPVEMFEKKIQEGLNNNKYIQTTHEKRLIEERINEELPVYEKVGAIDFMLLETYIREWEKQNDIQRGYGRGSVSGSLIAYLLNITEMDSLKFDLNFFRFLNPDRVTNSDIDCDYSEEDRDKLKYFLLHDKLNLDNIKTSEIITFNTVAMKGTIKEICRAIGINIKEAQEISNAVEVSENGNWTIDDSWRRKYPNVFKYVDIISGTIVSIGSHPSGVLISDMDIESEIGLCTKSGSEYPISMLDMHPLDELMYVKLDLLGLDNIGIINKTCKLLGIERLNPDNTNLNDENVWKSIREDTTAIFQWESNSAKQYLKNFMSDETINKVRILNPNFSYIKWFSFGNGLLRPACASYRDEVAKGNFYDNGLKELNDFLAPEMGHVCMQETIMKFLVKFCGYSQAESDNVRRAIAKKQGTVTLLPEIEKRFIDYTSVKYNITKEKCTEIIKPFIQIILDASSYGFSWNHSDAYSCIGYICGYLRYYYPLEFLTAAFNTFADKKDKLINLTEYANKIKIKIQPIKFRHSIFKCSYDKSTNSIFKGLNSVKYISENIVNGLTKLGKMQCNNFIDFLVNNSQLEIKEERCNKRHIEVLIKLNYFSEFGKSKYLLKIYEIFDSYYGKKSINKEKCLVPHEIMSQYSQETEKMYKIQDSVLLVNNLISMIPNEDISLREKVDSSIEYLNCIQPSLIESDRKKLYIESIKELKTKEDKRKFGYSIETTSLGSGKRGRLTIFSKIYNQYGKIGEGDIIKVETLHSERGYFILDKYNIISKYTESTREENKI